MISCRNHELKESIPLAGTNLTLNYSSSGSEFRNTVSHTIKENVPLPQNSGVKKVEFKFTVAGQVIKQTVDVDPLNPSNADFSYTWDGRDRFNRQIPSIVKGNLLIAYDMDRYIEVTNSTQRSIFGLSPRVLQTQEDPTIEGTEIYKSFSYPLGRPSYSARFKMGGWMLSEYHYFDPASKILLMGDGQRLNRFYLKQDIILPFAIETLSGFISRSYSYGTREVNIPSDDGRTIYRFSEGGSHLATIDSMTGVTLNRFVHNSRGFLTDIYDVDNNNTHIDRDAGDEIVAIVGPYGTRTSFSMDEDGRLATVRDENGSEYHFGYSMGILTSFTNPRGMTNTYEYDVRGDLIRATDAYSNYKTVDNMPSADLTRLSSMYTNYWTQGVAFTSPMGRRTLYLTSAEDSMDLTFANIYPDGSGFKNIVRLDPSYFLPWGETNTDFNGEEKVIEFAADPRFEYIRLPVKETNSRSRNISGITQYNRKIDLSDSSDPLSVSTFTDSIYLDGIGEYKETYNKRENSITYETPSGRTAIETLNAQGHVISAQTYMLEKVYYTYGSDGLLLHQQQGDRLYSFAYQKGLISGITDPMSNRWEFAYDAVGRLINSSLPNGYKVSYAYDENGNVKSITLPNDHSQIMPMITEIYQGLTLSLVYLE